MPSVPRLKSEAPNRTNADQTHNLQLYGVHELPFGPGRKWAREGLAGKVAGGWQLNGVLSATSGTPFTVPANAASLNAPGNTQTADQVVDDVGILGGVGRGNSYFDPAAFAPVTGARFGTGGRNNVRGPGLLNVDASAFSDFKIAMGVTMQVRAEVVNLTNRPGSTTLAPTRRRPPAPPMARSST